MSDEKKSEELLDLFVSTAYDEAKANKGAWFNYKSGKMLIAAYASREFTNAHAIFSRKYPTQESRENDEAQVQYEALIARHILLGWSGFKQAYSEDAAKQLLRSRIAREWVMSIAVDSSNFRPDEAGVLKNL